MRRHAVFEDDDRHRVWLEREWSDGPTVTFCMKNPSTADAEREDPTLHRIIGFARRWGFGRLIVVNADTFRTPHPESLYEWWDTLGADECYRVRQRAIERAIHAWQLSSLFIAAWGNAPEDFGRWYISFRRHLEEAGVVLHHLGLTNGGWPRHPLARGRHRIPDDQVPIRWSEL